MVAPFAGNNMLVLYSCPPNSSSKYFVQVLHNEHPIPMPVSFNQQAASTCHDIFSPVFIFHYLVYHFGCISNEIFWTPTSPFYIFYKHV